MGLASLVQTTTYRWTIGVALALLLQASLIGGLIYWSTVDYATGKIDDTLVADCRTLAGLPRADLLEEIGEKVERDVHRVELVGLFDAGGQAIKVNIASLPRTLTTTTGPVVVGLVRTSPPDPKPNPSRAVGCSTLQVNGSSSPMTLTKSMISARSSERSPSPLYRRSLRQLSSDLFSCDVDKPASGRCGGQLTT